MRTVMFDSEQGTKVHLDCVPDYTITDFRDLLRILDWPWAGHPQRSTGLHHGSTDTARGRRR
jgi:hypothetical protein